MERWNRWVDEHERITLGALLLFYLAVGLSQASVKLLWTDELITYYLSEQPGLGGVWRALEAGCDPNPPLLHLLVKGSTALLGGNAVGIRVPAVLCVLVAILAMWWLLRRWVRPVFALAGTLAFMATRGFDYAYDARSYAPMMAFTMGSLAFWTLANDLAGWRRAVALGGMAAMLTAGVSSNYYGVLALFPIAIGEIVGRRWRTGSWIAMGLGSLPLIAYLPLIRHGIAEFGPHAWNRPQVSMLTMSYVELVEAIFWPVLVLGIWAFRHRESLSPLEMKASQLRPEMAAVGVLLVYPFFGYAIAAGIAGMISPRCVVPVCCGIGLTAGVLGQQVFGASRRAGTAFVLGLVVWVGVRELVCEHILREQRDAFFRLRDRAAGYRVKGEPGQILVGDSLFALPFYFYSGVETRQRIEFPVDFDAIHRMEKDDSGEQNIWAGRNGVLPMRILAFADVDLNTPVSLAIARSDGWLATEMRRRGVPLIAATEQEGSPGSDWRRLGGVFTPMAHPGTEMLYTRSDPVR